MNIYDFLDERIAWEESQERHTPNKREAAELAFKRKVLELAKLWPIYNIKEFDPRTPDAITLVMTSRHEWMLRESYIKQFGKEPPLTPLVKMMAEIYSDHPDFDPEWRTQ